MSVSTITTAHEEAFLNVVRERHSVRVYDPKVVIPREELKEILSLTMLAPSSSNMQHTRFLVIDTPEQKQKLLPIANNQQQVVDASAVVAILGDKEAYRNAEQIYGQAVKAGYMAEELAKTFTQNSVNLYSSLPPAMSREVAVVDASLAAMQLMLVAKAKGYDTVPMGGYNREKFAEAFGLGDRYVPVMLIPIGKAAKTAHGTTRLPIEDVTFWNEVNN
ncbi:nitroreductase family protein [Cohnella pontilimi]|uniref:Nitroreductase family protein n=1 Tax=Cohnella pontilimi TaxID=2564100 RepID=A0A4U0FD61_9BACL|nr:nitroreductase family protein [Cohnella pontilimi]TJY42691.1 nitroreductase family protein [Cohnella pontilimi]